MNQEHMYIYAPRYTHNERENGKKLELRHHESAMKNAWHYFLSCQKMGIEELKNGLDTQKWQLKIRNETIPPV